MNLTGYLWKGNDVLDFTDGFGVFITFSNNGTRYLMLTFQATGRLTYGNTDVYINGQWVNESYKNIIFLGGNPSDDFIELLTRNGTLTNDFIHVTKNGQGDVTTSLSGTTLTINATESEGYVFNKIVVNGVEYTTRNVELDIYDECFITAYFDEIIYFNIDVKANPDIVLVKKSANRVEEGEEVTLKAFEVQGYNFVGWSDGATDNPYTFTPTSDVNLTAEYKQIVKTSEILNWYAYVKDKTSLNGKPKALMTIISFKVGEDLLTTQNSSINVTYVPSDVNIGDIVCLYNPYGKVRYMGIIKAIKNNEIQLSQMQSFYKGIWLKDTYSTATTIEEEFAYLLNRYAQGYTKGSSYYDRLQRLEKEPLEIITGSTTSGNLVTPKENETIDMESFIYSLYENYQILLDFYIPYGEWDIGDDGGGSVTIKKPNYSSMKVSDNANCVVEISPTTKVAKTNKLIVYSKEGVYRSTFYATVNGIVEEGTTIIGRIGEIDTKIVFSDDELTDIVQANLSEEMFNHKITFTILLDNKLYKYDDFKLGMPVEIVKGVDTYNSVITGFEISKNETENVISATFTCGFARTSLTKSLTRRLGIV